MTLRRPRSVFLLAAALTTACGSRSPLQDSTGDGGAGASGMPGGGGAGGAGGTGGPGGAGGTGGTGDPGGAGGADCTVLQVAGPPAVLEGGFGDHEQSPRWAFSSDDAAQVTLVASRQATEGPGGSDFPIRLVHTTLEPWVTFPSGGFLGPSSSASGDGGATFAVAGSPGGRFALLFGDAKPPDGGLLFSNDLHPFESTPPLAKLVDPTAQQALFAARGPGGHLLGMHLSGAAGGGDAYLLHGALAGGDGSITGPVPLGCASGPMWADAVPAGEGWILALSSGGEQLGAGDCLDPGLSWPDKVHVVRTNGFEYKLTDSLGAPGGATDVKVAARKDGAWVVAGTPPGQVVSGLFLAARVDLEGHVVAMFPVGGGATAEEIPLNGTLAAGSVGDHLAVAWVDYGGDEGPFLSVKLFDPEGTPAGRLALFPGGTFSGAPALLGSRTTNSLLLAWSEAPAPGMGPGDKVRAVRIDCAGSP